MGLRRLAGPFTMVDGFSGLAVVSSTPHTAAYPAVWVPACGLMLQINGYVYRVTLDGVAQNLALAVSPGVVPDAWGLDDVLTVLLQTSSGVVWAREKIAACPYLVAPGFPTPNTSGGQKQFYDLYGRRLVVNQPGVTHAPYLYSGVASGSFQPEAAIPYTGPVTFSRGRVNGEIFIGWSDTATSKLSGVFYQTYTQLLTSPVLHLGVAGASVVFAKDFGVLVSVGTDFSVGVWSLEVLPVVLTTPIIAGSANGMTTYQVQLQGADGDFCAGELVEWAISGIGILVDTQTTTDINGRALCRVIYDPALDPGNSTVTAEVLC